MNFGALAEQARALQQKQAAESKKTLAAQIQNKLELQLPSLENMSKADLQQLLLKLGRA